jgi:hypothetical protein
MKIRKFIYHVHPNWYKHPEIDFINFEKSPVKFIDGKKSKTVEIKITEIDVDK